MKRGVWRVSLLVIASSFLLSVSVVAATERKHAATTSWQFEQHLALEACVIAQGEGIAGSNDLWVQNAELCGVAHSPCSTFKIPNALIGLDSGVISGPDHLLRWDGEARSRDVVNRDHDLASAIANSVVWYFQHLAREVGHQRMQGYLELLDYGNQDISGGIDNFWLASSLKLTAFEQLQLIQALRKGELPFSADHQQQVRDMLAVAETPHGTLYGKTGSCWPGREGESDHAWFVGWLDTPDGSVDVVALHKTPKAMGSNLKQAFIRAFTPPAH